MNYLPDTYPISLGDFDLEDDGTIDTVITFRPNGYDLERTYRYSDTSAYRDMSGMLRFTDFLRDTVIPDLEADPDIWSA